MNRATAFRSLLVVVTFLLAYYGKAIAEEAFGKIPFTSDLFRIFYFYSWWIVPVILTTGLLFGFRNIAKVLGLQRGFLQGTLFSALVVLPMFLSTAIIAHLDPDLNWPQLFRQTVVAGFTEELLFRGFLFGILFRKMGWGFIPASIAGALFFAMGHVYQGRDPMEVTGIFLITFAGALWFAWLYIEWDENLWVPVMLHTFMNLSWALFNTGQNALGDMYTNIFRFVTIALTVVITIVNCRKRGWFSINASTLLHNKASNTLSAMHN